MYRELRNDLSYRRVMVIYSLLAVVSGLAFSFFGELFLPFAVAFLAMLFVFENPSKRVLSYLVPAVILGVSIPFRGLLSLIAVLAIGMAVILAALYASRASKAEAAFYLTVITTLSIILSLYLGAARDIGNYSPEAVSEYFTKLVSELQDKLIYYLSSYEMPNAEGSSAYLMTQDDATSYVTALLALLPSIFAVFSFFLSGVAIKIFSSSARRTCKYGILRRFSHFFTSNIFAYFYIAVAIISALSMFMGSEGGVLSTLDALFMCVYAYIGFKYVLDYSSISEKRGLIRSILIFALLFMTSLSIQILSYVGVYINIAVNRGASALDGENR